MGKEKLAAVARRITEQPTSPFSSKGLAVVAARDDRPAERLFTGTDAKGVPVREDTLFMLGSTSKLALALSLLRLADRGALAVDDPLERHLPEAAAARPGVTLRRLLSHTSGLPLDLDPGLSLYDERLDGQSAAVACLRTGLETAPGERVQYSNVAYSLIAQVVERVTRQHIAAALRHLVLDPLGIEAYLGEAPPRRPAAIEGVAGVHAGTALEPYNSGFFQQLGLPWTGLISTADGLLALIRAFTGAPAGFLSAAALADATSDQTGHLGGGFCTTAPFFGMGHMASAPLSWPRCPWGLGVELRGEKSPHWAPARAPAGSFGQVASTGCVAWADPKAGVAWALLGTHTTDSGWLLRHGPAVGAAVCEADAPRPIAPDAGAVASA